MLCVILNNLDLFERRGSPCQGREKVECRRAFVGEQWDESNLIERTGLNPMQLASQGLWLVKLLQGRVLLLSQYRACTTGTLGLAELWVEGIILNQFAAFLPAPSRARHLVSHCSSMDFAQKAGGASKAKSTATLLSLSPSNTPSWVTQWWHTICLQSDFLLSLTQTGWASSINKRLCTSKIN